MSGELRALGTEIGAEIARSQRAVEECRDGFTKMMLAAEFGALSKMLLCVRRAASVDTLPKGQDAKQGLAGTEGSAVAATSGETPND